MNASSSMSTSEFPTIYIFSEFTKLEALKSLVGNKAKIVVSDPFTCPQPDYVKNNIKIFHAASLDCQEAADNVAHLLINKEFAKFVTNQLYSTDSSGKTISLPRDRIILELIHS